ncbi:MAG: hypothetical protein H0W06_00095 [Chloroflexia bacterium]|nr:hypothetical protein [Chloroflexia bacterium]
MVEPLRREHLNCFDEHAFDDRGRSFPSVDFLKESTGSLSLLRLVSSQNPDEDVRVDQLHRLVQPFAGSMFRMLVMSDLLDLLP